MKNRREKKRKSEEERKKTGQKWLYKVAAQYREVETEGNVSGDSKTTGQIFLLYLDLYLG